MLQYWQVILILTLCGDLAYAADPPPLPNRETKGAHTGSPNENVTPDHFIAFRPFDIPILQDDEVKGYVGVTVTLEAHTPQEAEKIKLRTHHIREAIFIEIYSIMYLLWRDDFTPDIDLIRRSVEKAAKKTLDGDYIQAIYTKDFYVRKIRIPLS